MRATEVRPIEQRVNVYRCDRCGNEIPTKRNSGGGSDLQEGTNLSSRSGHGWEPLVTQREEYGTHGPEFHAANVDICGSCLSSLREWFSAGSNQDQGRGSK